MATLNPSSVALGAPRTAPTKSTAENESMAVGSSSDSSAMQLNKMLADLAPLFKKLEALIIAKLKNPVSSSPQASGSANALSAPPRIQMMPASPRSNIGTTRPAPQTGSVVRSNNPGSQAAKFPNSPSKGGTNAANDSAVVGGMNQVRSRYGKHILAQESGAKSVAFDSSNQGAAGLTQMRAGREGDQITLQPIQDPAYRKHVSAHEYVHSITSANFAKSFNNSQLEGITDVMAQNVTGHDHSVYSKERAAAKRVQSMVGEETMAKAIFSGDLQAIAKVKAAFSSVGG
jgi:hypothetical protein